MTTKKTEQKSGLSTTSLVLSIVWLLLSMTIIWAFLWIPLALLWLIFGIIALVQKQKRWTAIAWVVIWGIVTLITLAIVIFGTIFLKNNADLIIEPIKWVAEMMENDPELATMMNNPMIQAEFELLFKTRLAEKFGEDFAENEEFESRDDIKTQIPVIFDEMKIIMLELKEKHSVE